MPRRSKAFKEQWQREIDEELSRRKPRRVRNVSTQTFYKLEDKRRFIRVKSKFSGRADRKPISKKEQANSAIESWLPKVSSKEIPSLTRLAARVFLRDIVLYLDCAQEFRQHTPPNLRLILLQEAVVLSEARYTWYRKTLKKNQNIDCPQPIVDNNILSLLLSGTFDSLDLSYSMITDDIVRNLLAPRFEQNGLSSANAFHENSWEDSVKDTEVVKIRGLVGLTSLNVSFCGEISDEFVLRAAEELPRLKCLNLAGNFSRDGMGEPALSALVNNKKPVFDSLIRLNLSFCDWLTPGLLESTGIVNRNQTTLMPSLKVLVLKSCSQLCSGQTRKDVFNLSDSDPCFPIEDYKDYKEIVDLVYYLQCEIEAIEEWRKNPTTGKYCPYSYYRIRARISDRSLKISV
mmetsp:Transcript_10906/g.14200  ORF Transcript_10906/g.14200 Transcript_10906/m.14200 type:complete len:403 (-) Transcript_10906:440-1648(-)